MITRWRGLAVVLGVGGVLAQAACGSSGGAGRADAGAGGAGGGAAGAGGSSSTGGAAGGADASSGGSDARADAGDGPDDGGAEAGPPLAKPLTWTLRTSPTTKDLLRLASNGDVIVAVGPGVILTSPDGVTWTSQTFPGGLSVQTQFEYAAWGNGMFVIAGRSSALMTSPDGVTWSLANITPTSNFDGVTFELGRFFLTMITQDTYYDSPDGVTWNARSVASSFDTDWYGMLSFSAHGVVFASGADLVPGHNFKTTDGTTWQRLDSWGTIAYDAAYGNGRFCVGAAYGMRTSADATTWTDVPVPGSGGGAMLGVAYATDRFVAVGDFDQPFVSLDCQSWSAGAAPALTGLPDNTFLEHVRVHKDKVVVVGKNGVILTAPLP
jgi:hypothetical protein